MDYFTPDEICYENCLWMDGWMDAGDVEELFSRTA